MGAGESTVGAVVLDRIGAQAAVLAGLDDAVRADEPDAVHRMRVACRRLRSALRTYRRLFEVGVTEELVAELRWLAAALGRARDREVLGERLVGRARELPAACGPERVAGALELWARAEYLRVWPEIVAALDSPRRRALADGLAVLLADPPLRGRAARRAGPELARIAAREQRRTAKRVRRALAPERDGAASDGAARDEALHEARKAAKRARYAGETAVPVAGEAAERYVERMKAVQDVLGEHQDAVVAAAALRENADGSGEPFGYGVLYERELAAGAAARRELRPTWERAAGRKLARFG
ncbi:CHAD domain-containing protein [Kitasatospora sp. RG8]|uniref:CHAD domain-containing protein n=1 Tax=Kitasatospora sp. RG8 TaxID=2820815 RepID=UPI001AE0B52A|nr:CHAD domain-containing protein [Kitasatospora sp. RG8]MBP0448881.1 CHAD domain-containing protein [Kitasatospora sp. RG8]